MKNQRKFLKMILLLIIFIINFSIYLFMPLKVMATKSDKIPEILSQGAVLMDSKTGKILYGKNENEKLYPASTTKVLTAIIAIENCKPHDMLTASNNAVMSIPSGYSNAAIQPGETIDFTNLLDMFLIHSANEVGYIFAEHISGSVENFADLMNQKAKEIGCLNTHFTNPSGIHDVNHYSTTYDMALIFKYCMENQQFRDSIGKEYCTIEPTEKYEKRFFRNTNDLINSKHKYGYKYCIGGKTGYTKQAKRCLLSASKKDDLELIVAILGAEPTTGYDNRYEDSIKLFDYGFDNFENYHFASKNHTVKNVEIENANEKDNKLSIIIKDDISGIIPSNIREGEISKNIKLEDTIIAPIKKGDILGNITYSVDNYKYSSDLIAGNSIYEYNKTISVMQIIFALIIGIFLFYLIFFRKNNKRKYKKNKKSKKKLKKTNRKSKHSDSIYKFN